MSDFFIENTTLMKYLGHETNVTIPEGILSIVGDWKNGAFINCNTVENVTIPASVTDIGYTAFNQCKNLIRINVAESNPSYCSIDGVLFNKDATELLRYPQGRKGDYHIPDVVRKIDKSAFYHCTHLTDVIFSDSIKIIEHSAFCGCSLLKDIRLPDSLEIIGESAFSFCSLITSVRIPAKVSRIGFGDIEVFDDTNIDSIEVSSENESYASFDGMLFTANRETLIWCPPKKAGAIQLPKNLRIIQNYAFYDCNLITEITIPESVKHIGHSAFDSCTKLTSITIPKSVKVIASGTFEDCNKLKEVVLQEGLKEIEAHAFRGCTSLKRIQLPKTVTIIEEGAFSEPLIFLCQPEIFSSFKVTARIPTAIAYLKDASIFEEEQRASLNRFILFYSERLLPVIVETDDIEALMRYHAIAPLTSQQITASIKTSTEMGKIMITAALLEIKHNSSK